MVAHTPHPSDEMAQARGRTLHDMLPQALSLVRQDGVVIFANRAWSKLWGLDATTAQQRVAGHYNLLADCTANQAPLAELINKALSGTETLTRRLRFQPRSIAGARARDVAVTCKAVTPALQPVNEVWVIFEDRTAAQAGGLASNYDLGQLVAIVNAAPDPIFIKDQACRYTLMNQPFLDVCALSKEAEGRTDEELFPEEFVRTIRQNDDRVLNEGQVLRVEERLFLRGAWRLFDALKFPLRDAEGRILAMGGIATDITERRHAESENSRLQVSERAAQEASALKSQFLATVSHEIRTPLAGIIGLVDLLLDSQQVGHDSTNHVTSIGQAAHSLLRIVNDILDFSKLESGKMQFENEVFRLREQFEALIATLQPSAALKHIELVLHVDTATPQVLIGDPLRVQQIMNNLVGNAIKFSRKCQVTLTVRPTDAQSDPQSVELQFVVADRGIGIAQENLAKLFKPFSQADSSVSRKFGGTGLGLSICRILAEAMGGTIGVTSTQGVGTTFTVNLKFGVGQQTTVAPKLKENTPALLAGHVLLVEDNYINQTVLSAMLKKIGVTMTLAPNGETAVELCKRQRFDAVLMDCHMPGIDGLEATRRIRNQVVASVGQPPIIALTANAMPDERSKCLAAGMNDYLIKPVKLLDLRATLLQHMVPARTHK